MRPTFRERTRRGFVLLVVVLLFAPSRGRAQEDAEDVQSRRQVEAELPLVEAAFGAAPESDANRRAYAELLFQLGDVWQASEVIAPLATTSSDNADDVRLGARLAYLLGNYDWAEALYQRLRSIAPDGSNVQNDALRGLVLTYYQTDRYDMVRNIALPEEDSASGRGTRLACTSPT